MLAMPEINHIKKLRNIKSLSINETSKRTGFCWETVKKYADEDQLPEEKVPTKRGMKYTEKWGEIVSDWLMEDYALKKKLRRNNKNIFEQLLKLRDGRFQQLRNKFNKVDMIILDEMGYVPFTKEGAELLFQLISDWYEQRSLVVTSNLEFSQWNRIFV